MKTPEHRIEVAAADIAAKLKEGASENEVRATLFLAGADMDDINKSFELTIAPSFMEKLKKARKSAGMTQQQMADRMLIPKRTIEDWEAEKRTPPFYVQRFVLNELKEIADERMLKGQ